LVCKCPQALLGKLGEEIPRNLFYFGGRLKNPSLSHQLKIKKTINGNAEFFVEDSLRLF